MKFQLLGNAALVDHITRFNLCGAVQPAMMRDFCDRWGRYTEPDEYWKAKQQSQKVDSEHVRRSKRIHNLKEKVWRAELIADWVAEDEHNLYKLDASEQNLWTKMDELRTNLHDVLRTPAGLRHAEPGRAWPTCKRLSEPVLPKLLHVSTFTLTELIAQFCDLRVWLDVLS